MSHARSIIAPFLARGLKLNLVSSIVTKLSGLAQLFLISQGMGLEVYGAWALLNNAVGYLTHLVSLSLPNAFVRFHPTQPNVLGYERFFTLGCITLGTVLCGPFALLAGWAATTFLKSDAFTPLLQAGALLIPLNVARLFLTDTMRARGRLNSSAIVNIGFEVIESGTITIAVLLHRSMLWVVNVEATVMVAIGGFALWRTFSIQAPGAPMIPPNVKDVASIYLRHSLPLIPSAFLGQLASNGDRFLVGYFLGAAQVGLYNSLYAVGSVVMLFNTPFTNVLLPRIVRQLAAGRISEASQDVFRFCAAFFAIGIVGILGLLTFGPWILPVVLKLGTATPLEASQQCALLMLALTVFGTTRIYSLHLHARSKTRSLFLAYGSGVLMNQVANLALIPWMGLPGAFLAGLVSYATIAVVLWSLVRRSSIQSGPGQLTPNPTTYLE